MIDNLPAEFVQECMWLNDTASAVIEESGGL
jgi:hypothetical protein